MHLCHDVLVVVVSQCPTQFVVVHVGLALSLTPPPGYLVGVGQLELAVGPLPRDAVGVAAVRQKFQEKLPQLNLAASWRHMKRNVFVRVTSKGQQKYQVSRK
ncbi:uncharacterized protein TNIN_442001 [Trichonephila inaurata madagascariensis]|uniref:Uncharacterized protein n=1 Tax=Trichonephila inaurata madagascariensis TaxID=2747483 RepID=A0A8X6XCU6_9ARAC|nr:uncharacterized protein TNIN_442001 [Trichonephila inaurata madagascariensis]